MVFDVPLHHVADIRYAVAHAHLTQGEIDRQRDAALDMIRKESVDLALAAASRLLQENMDGAKDREMVESFLNEVSDGRGARA